MSRSTRTEIEESLSRIWTRENDFQTAVQEEADAKHLFEMENAKAYLAADGTEKFRTATAMVKCETYHGDYLKKKAVLSFTRIKLQDAQNALSAQQSLMRAEMGSDAGYANDRRVT